MPSYLDRAANPRLLHTAFLKARSWAWEQPYYDTVEVKLLEWRLRRNLGMIGERIKRGYDFAPLVGYHLPKDLAGTRRFAYRNFIDEVATVAAVEAIGPRMEREMDAGGAVSFGNRLDLAADSDRLFVPWDRAWDRLSRACNASARRSPWHLRTDVEQFYPEIPVDRLNGVLRSLLPNDPIIGFFARLNALPVPFLPRGRGIPAGPAISGFLANLYLLPLDRFVRGKWGAAGRFRRYVDDMFLFTRTRSAAVRAHRALAAMVRERFGLRLHDAKKTEFSFSREPMGRGRSPRDLDEAERLFDRIYGSLYRFPPRLKARFRAEPDRLLKWYARGLRWLGVYVSTDWLAQRLLTVQSRGGGSRWLRSRSYYRLDIPDVELFGVETVGMKGWSEDFAERNPVFMRDLHRLHGMLRRMTRDAYADLGDVRKQSKKDLKGRIFTLRNFAGRLALMDCGRDQNIFSMLIDHPWILDPAIGINAFLSMPRPFERLRGLMQSDRPALIRAKAAWALGELGDRRAVRPLWETAAHGEGAIARRSALESLLRIDDWQGIPAEWVFGEARRESDPAIRKYHYLILGRMRPDRLADFLKEAAARETDFTARLAIEHAAHETGSLYHVVGHLARHAGPIRAVTVGHPAEWR
jgi:hypothetical protein